MLVLAQVSDFHIDGDHRSVLRAKRVMAYLNALAQRVDAVLVTGDVADHGTASEYETARSVLRLSVPGAGVPGQS
jgi:3',5'-cyclic-AMP phosphodiesterase